MSQFNALYAILVFVRNVLINGKRIPIYVQWNVLILNWSRVVSNKRINSFFSYLFILLSKVIEEIKELTEWIVFIPFIISFIKGTKLVWGEKEGRDSNLDSSCCLTKFMFVEVDILNLDILILKYLQLLFFIICKYCINYW